MTNEETAIAQHLSKPRPTLSACSCMGPQNGDPFCFCDMKMIEIVEGKYYRITEHRKTKTIDHTAELVEL